MAGVTDKSLMQEVWRQGFLRPDGITLHGHTQGNASRLRFALYNAVKPYRDFKQEPDEVLRNALDSCSVALVNNGLDVHVGRKLLTDSAQGILEQLGVTADDLQTVETRVQSEAIERLQARVEALSPTGGLGKDSSSKYGARE